MRSTPKYKQARAVKRRALLDDLEAHRRAIRGEPEPPPRAKPEPPPDRPALRGFGLDDAQPFASTERRPGRRVAKTGDMLSPLYLEFVQGLPCAFCGAEPQCDAHHFPAIGGLGFRCDLSTVPACRGVDGDNCHRKAQAYEIDRDRQYEALGRTLAAFCAQPADWKARVLDELRGDL